MIKRKPDLFVKKRQGFVYHVINWWNLQEGQVIDPNWNF